MKVIHNCKHHSFHVDFCINIHNELLRYIELPGQALTYKVGEKTIKYLRDVYLKEGYSIKDFHELIMGIGPCPLDILVNELL